MKSRSNTLKKWSNNIIELIKQKKVSEIKILLSSNPENKVLKLSGIKLKKIELQDEDIKVLLEALDNNQNITELNLSDNKIGVQGASMIASFLSSNNTLSILNLANNNIGTKGAFIFGKSLMDNNTLTSLNIRRNQIEAEGAIGLRNGLECNNSVKEIYIGWNNVEKNLKSEITSCVDQNKNSPEEALARAVGKYLIVKFDKQEIMSEQSDLLFVKRYAKVSVTLLKSYLINKNKYLDNFKEDINKLVFRNVEDEKILLNQEIERQLLKSEHNIKVQNDIAEPIVDKSTVDESVESKYGLVDIMYLINSDNIINAVKLIKQMTKKELSQQDDEGKTILHYAVEQNKPEIVKAVLLKDIGLLGVKDNYDNTSIMLAKIFEFENIVELLENFNGNGLDEYEDLSYWYQYSRDGIDQLLKLRLASEEIEGIKIINPGYFYDESKTTATSLALDIAKSLVHNKQILVILNLYAKHWVGFGIDKTDNVININYMDSEQNDIPKLLKIELLNQIGGLQPNSEINLNIIPLEMQKHNNCGPEVIENVMKYLIDERCMQEEAPILHSILLEQFLSDNESFF